MDSTVPNAPPQPSLTPSAQPPITQPTLSQPSTVYSNQPQSSKHFILFGILIGLVAVFLIAAILFVVYKPNFDFKSLNIPFGNSSGTTKIPIQDPKTQTAFNSANDLIHQVDWNSPAANYAGVLYAYHGNIVEIKSSSDGLVEFTTDTKIEGLPNTWKYTIRTTTFSLPNMDKLDPKELTIGDEVYVTALFPVISKNERNEAFVPNQFNLGNVIRATKK